MGKKVWHQVGTIRQAESGKLYIKLHQTKTKDGKYTSAGLRELADVLENCGSDGVALHIEKPQDKIQRLASLGFIDEDKVESRLESIPDYIKYEITLPAQED